MNELVKNYDGKLVTTSLLIAKKFGKEHKNVIQSIQNNIKNINDIDHLFHAAENSAAKWFIESSYVDKKGNNQPMFLLDRSGFNFVVMGFNGKEAVKYKIEFITAFNEMEKIITNALQPLSESELILRSAQMLVNLERNQKAIEARVKAIEERPQINSEVQHFSILGYCNNIHKQISINEAKTYGQKCRRLCNELGMVIGKIADPRFGSVNTYPLDILREVIK